MFSLKNCNNDTSDEERSEQFIQGWETKSGRQGTDLPDKGGNHERITTKFICMLALNGIWKNIKNLKKRQNTCRGGSKPLTSSELTNHSSRRRAKVHSNTLTTASDLKRKTREKS